MASRSQIEEPGNVIIQPQAQNVLDIPGSPSQKRPLPHILEIGITELWCPPAPTEILADICFVHGLKGHPFKTWYDDRGSGTEEARTATKTKKLKSFFRSARTKEDQVVDGDTLDPKKATRKHHGYYWPFDFIPNDFPNVRVLTYGYDSHPSHFYVGKTNQMTITQHAQTLLQKLTNNRVDCLTRPIIFVAHSLGGILVKDAIVQSSKYENHLKSLSQSCSAIFFFGTPHHGASAARYGEILTNVVGTLPGGFSMYKEILRGLKPNGEKLSLVEGDFNQFLNQNIPAEEKIQLYSFQESKPISSVKRFDGKVVPDLSSFFNRKDIEQCSHINENHMDMARFRSPSSSAYADFTAGIKGFLERIKRRREQSKSIVQERERARLATEHKVLMEILDFKERCVRQQQVSSTETTQKTFDWIWTSTFKEWLEHETPFFWISGKPASGKSTLMNYIAQAKETIQTLQNAHNRQWKVIYFFFDFRARDGIGNNMEGFIRCLLFQLCRDLPDLTQNIPELQHFLDSSTREQSTFTSERPLPIESLKKAFLQCLRNRSENIIILVDGLDEYEGQKVELTNFLKSLRRQNIKICIASRPDPPFPDAFEGIPKILMQELNFDAITCFSLNVLEQFYSSHQHTPAALHSLAKDVAQRSQGVFLWARFAIYELIEGLSYGESLGSPALEERLEAVPEEMEHIYSRIFKRYSPAYRKAAAIVLLLICYKVQEVTIGMLELAVRYHPEAWRDVADHWMLKSPETNDKSFSKRLLALTGGIVEDLPAQGRFMGMKFDCSLPRLIHRTADTFLEANGWKLLLGDEFALELGHEIWLRICAEAIYREGPSLSLRFPPNPDDDPSFYGLFFGLQKPLEVLEDESNIESSSSEAHSEKPGSEILLLAYATRRMFRHALDYEKLSTLSSRTLLPALNTAFIGIHARMGDGVCDWISMDHVSEIYDMDIEPIDYAVVHGLLLYVSECFRDGLQQQQQFRVGARQWIVGKFYGLLGHETSSSIAGTFNRRLRFLKALLLCDRHLESDPGHDTAFSMLKLLYEYSPVVADHELFCAVVNTSPKIVQWLITRRQHLDMKNLDIKLVGPGIDLDIKELCGSKNITLLAALGLRIAAGDWKDTRTILHYLAERGVTISEKCGPLGGILQYVIVKYADDIDELFEGLKVLVEEGADINQGGIRGKPLELLWEVANQSDYSSIHDVHYARRAIEKLLDHGAINERKDPYGQVPSKIQMKLFGCNWTDYQECKRYHQEGPRVAGKTWPGPVPLNPSDAFKLYSPYEIPYKQAMRRYREAMGIEIPSDEEEEGEE
ncbi:hypothetical protein LTR84_004077 [Exophiala bonariae]|uniref:Nephrocystin 3-like N-terminal domain-containing protein n=1 Tax=Exophiala bonariae TaxID=1690606 RepID=A0AAV9N5N0_9EURO|nr:hypothetical protein LTR84_004077 [Exophiala bonariae]